jgi:hypothetical protein
MKKYLIGTLCLLGLAVSPAWAQYFPPLTSPYARPPLLPYSGGFYGNPAARLYGYPGYPGTMGYPYGSPYGTTSPVAPNPYGAAQLPGILGSAGQVTITTARSADLTDPMVTGHPTRFFSYSNYFFNQGGAVTTITTPVQGLTQPPRALPVIGTGTSRGRPATKSTGS